MTALRKAQAGADSYGNTWPYPGAVVDVPPAQAAVLLRIKDGGFVEVPESEMAQQPSRPAKREAARG